MDQLQMLKLLAYFLSIVIIRIRYMFQYTPVSIRGGYISSSLRYETFDWSSYGH